MHRVAVALLLALAGCAGLVSPVPVTPTETVTPVAVPDDPEPTGRYPPGVSAAGVVSPARLAQGHVDALSETSFTVTRTEVRRDANGTVIERYERRVYRGETPAEFYYLLEATDRTTSPVNRTDERWSDGERAFSAVTLDGNRTVSERFLGPLAGNATNGQGVFRLFRVLDTRLVGEETREGTRLFRVAAGPGESVPPSISDVAFEAVIDADGVVRAYDLTYAIERGDDRLRIQVTERYTDIGSTTVPTPEWVPEETTTE